MKNLNNYTYIPRLKFPTELEFEPIQLCNALCFTCPYTTLQEDKEYRGKKMSREKISLLLTDFGNLLKKNNYKGNAHVNPFRYSDPLICKDLDLIFSLAKKFSFKVRITTNGVSFNENNAKLLNEYFDTLEGIISISVIGSTTEKIKKNMNVNLDLTFARLSNVKLKFPKLASKIKVGLAEVEETSEENQEFLTLEKKFKEIGIETYRKKKWINNRIKGESYLQKPDNFIMSCNLYHNKLLRRMNVMCDGSVVLCDDDSSGRKKFGNVFEDNVTKIWNGPLLKEHKLMYNRNFDEEKNQLICKSCSRANWKSRKSGLVNSVKQIGFKSSIKNIISNNVDWL